MERNDYNRENLYNPEPGPMTPDPMADFKAETDNQSFKSHAMTWLALFVFVIAFPAMSILPGTDTSEILGQLNEFTRIITYIVTIVMLWGLFGLVWVATSFERTGLKGIGFYKLRGIDFAWAIAAVLAAFAIVTGVAWMLGLIGMPVPGEIAMLLPTEWTGRILWVVMSFTAGFCEEAVFRGFLMTRIRLIFGLKSWVIPVIASTAIFAVCHAYQSFSGMIVIGIYGLILALIYIRSRSLWPVIIAHFFQDFANLFIPQ
jgi:membrane protease YdiL (CAAX protease family)